MKKEMTNTKKEKAMNRTWLRLGIVIVALMGFVSGCSQVQPEIDRIQPDAFKKEWLQGEWYYRSTVSESAALSSNTFPGAQSSLERGIFEVQENKLYFYRTYEWATGTDVLGQSTDVDTPLVDADGYPVMRTKVINGEDVEVPVYVYRGAPIVEFPISKHFDAKYTYNAATGEQTNVLAENSTDNKWYEREWMHVDWDGAYWSYDEPQMGFANAVSLSPMSSGSEDEAGVFDWAEDGTLNYFDFSSRKIQSASMIWYGSYGYIPACWFYPWAFGQIFECSSEEIQVRFAFKRVDPNNSYVAYDYNDKQLNKFGYYRAERPTYDPERGITYSGVSRKIIRQRIWEEYTKDENGNLDYANMTPKPIVYYMSPEFPRDLAVPSIEIAQEWSDVFTETVTFLKGEAPDHDMFILCENNLGEAMAADAAGLPTAVWMDDDANANAKYCDVTEAKKRYGDIRYSYLAAVNQPISYGLLGFGPPSFDPLTGEVITSNAYSYTGAMQRSASRALDTIEMMAGVRTFLEIESGTYIKLHGHTKRMNDATGHTANYTSEEVSNIAANLISPEVRTRLNAVGLKEDNNFTRTRMNMMRERPDLEALSIGEDVMALMRDPAYLTGETTSSEAIDEHLAPRNWATKSGIHKQEIEDHNHGISTIFLESFADNAILGLVREYKSRYDAGFCNDFEGQFSNVLDWDAFREVGDTCATPGAINEAGWECQTLTDEVAEGPANHWVNVCSTEKIVQQMRLGVEEIEGLDPNAAYDPPSPGYVDSKNEDLQELVLAFRAKLLELREVYYVEIYQMIYKGTQLHEVGHNLGLRHNFEGSTDALNFGEDYWKLKMFKDSEGVWHPVNLWQTETKNQAYNKMRTMQSTTVMDYSAKFNGRDAGLGYYDGAAIKYGYGGIVEVFNASPDMQALSPYMANPAISGQLGGQDAIPASGDQLEDAFKKLHHTNYLSYFGNSLESVYDRTNVLESDLSTETVEVPYRFCSDELAGYMPTCQRWDEGVDPFEIALNSADNYENYWPLMGYSHNAVTWSYNNYYRGVSRYYSEMRRMFELWVQQSILYNENDWWANNIGDGTPWDQDINGGLTYSMAAYESFNTIANSFGRPSESRFGRNPNTGRYEPINYYVTTTYTNQVAITQEDGARPFYNAYNFGGYMYVAYRAGAIYDRLLAYLYLTDPSTRPLLWADKSSNSLRYLSSYYTIFPNQMMRLMGSLMTSDEQNFGWWTCKNDQGKVTGIVRRNFFDTNAPEGCDQALYPETFSVFPNSKYRMPILAALYGMALMIDDTNYSFMDTSRLCLEGSGECMDVDAGYEKTQFADPLSGKIYTAYRVGDDNVYDAAFNLVEQANEEFNNYVDEETGELDLELLQDNYSLSELQFLIGRLELVRGMHNLYEW